VKKHPQRVPPQRVPPQRVPPQRVPPQRVPPQRVRPTLETYPIRFRGEPGDLHVAFDDDFPDLIFFQSVSEFSKMSAIYRDLQG